MSKLYMRKSKYKWKNNQCIIQNSIFTPFIGSSPLFALFLLRARKIHYFMILCLDYSSYYVTLIGKSRSLKGD